MTNIEEQFFKVFGIKPECSIEDVKNVKCVEKKCKDCIFCMKPEITAEKLLELIRIMNIYQGKSLIYGQSLNEMKYDILNKCILMHKKGLGMKTEVRALFGGEE